MSVLYRKYRPQVFSDIAGQEHVKKTLCEEVASGRLAHSYLFTGPRGVGKTTIARIFAKAVNCRKRQKNSGEPCDACDSCTQITEGRSLDVTEIDAASHTGVDNVRDQIIDNARFAPANSEYKIFIIDEVHMLSTSAFNALLKTLEEPPKHVIFILATTELHKLPATVVSRCQRFDFKKIPGKELVGRLQKLADAEGIRVDGDVFEMISRHSEGCLRDAESMLSQIFALGEKHVTAKTAALVMPSLSSESVSNLTEAIITKDVPTSLRLWEKMVLEGADLQRVIADITDIIRKMTLAHLRETHYEADYPVTDEQKKRLMTLQARLNPSEGADLLDRLIRVREEMKRVELIELPFEMMIMDRADLGEHGTDIKVRDSDSGVDESEPHASKSKRNSDSAASEQASSVVSRESQAVEESPADSATPESSQTTSIQESPANLVTPESPGDIRGAETKTKDKTSHDISLSAIREKWSEILMRSQEKNQGLPYMLGAGELISIENGELRIGFQYTLYRDRLNGKCKRMLEDVISEVMKAKVLVKGVLIEKKEEPKKKEALPDGFSDLVNDFGGSLAS